MVSYAYFFYNKVSKLKRKTDYQQE